MNNVAIDIVLFIFATSFAFIISLILPFNIMPTKIQKQSLEKPLS